MVLVLDTGIEEETKKAFGQGTGGGEKYKLPLKIRGGTIPLNTV